MLKVLRIIAGAYEENAYLAWVEGKRVALLVDPGDRAEMLLGELERRGLALAYILITHGHYDHILAVPELVRSTDASVWVHPRDESMLYDPYPLKLPGPVRARFEPLKLSDHRKVCGTVLDFEGVRIEMIDTPGHTPGGACFYVPDENLMFTGDTLFQDGVGRTDFASSRAADLRASLEKLFGMPPGIRILPGHGEGDTLGAVKRRLL